MPRGRADAPARDSGGPLPAVRTGARGGGAGRHVRRGLRRWRAPLAVRRRWRAIGRPEAPDRLSKNSVMSDYGPFLPLRRL